MRFLLLFLALAASALATVQDDVRVIQERHPDAISSLVTEDFLPYLRQGDVIVAIPSSHIKVGDLVWTKDDHPAVLSKVTEEGCYAKVKKQHLPVQTVGKVYAILHPRLEMLAQTRVAAASGTFVAVK